MHTLVVVGGPRLGDVGGRTGGVGFTPMVSVVSGGAVCVAGVALLAVLAPHLARYHAPRSPASTGVAG